ncbi:MAG: hypothetical protein WD749_09150 [Phycisphaerales bacterium]
MACGAAQADVVYQLNYEFSGAQAPAGSGPWMTVTFAQNGANTVRMTIANSLTGIESVGAFYFNIVQPILPTSVGVGFNGGLSSPGLSGAIFQKAGNPLSDANFKADGDGYFDFKLTFDSHAFNGTDVAVFDLTGAGLLESYFAELSEPGGGSGSYHAAAHVQRLGQNGEDSGWIGDGVVIPLPPAAWAGLSGLAGVGAIGVIRRRRTR